MDVTTRETLLFRKLTHAGSAGSYNTKEELIMKLNKKMLKKLILKEYYGIEVPKFKPGHGEAPDNTSDRYIDSRTGKLSDPEVIKANIKTVMYALSDAIQAFARRSKLGDYLERISGRDLRKQQSLLYNAAIELHSTLEGRMEMLEKPRKPSGGYRPRHFSRFLEEEQEGMELLQQAAQVFLSRNYDKSMMQKVGSFFGIGGASKFEESMTISSDDVRKMIQEEIANVIKENNG